MQHTGNKPATRTSGPVPVRLHGVLVRVFGAGIFLLGESGVGKSECALDLITRGHQLVADDAVDIISDDADLVGTAPEPTAGLLEIRGLGVIDVRKAFGGDARCETSTVDLCVEFRNDSEAERIGNFIHEQDIAGRFIPKFIMPVTPGRNMAVLIETAARLFLNRDSGAAAGDMLLNNCDNIVRSRTV